MSTQLSAADNTAITSLVASLETAWNQGDGNAFAAPFAADADFVNVRADHVQGRGAIAGGHAGIFKTIYANSVNKYSIVGTRSLSDDLAIVHVKAQLDVPGGPLAGQHRAIFSMVLRRNTPAWEVISFHNTMEPPTPSGR